MDGLPGPVMRIRSDKRGSRFGRARWWLLPLMMTAFAAAGAVALEPGFGVRPAAAMGDDIRILEEEGRVRFPEAVDFSLTAESDSKITEVRLNLRTSGARSWAYAYPAFEPGNRVTARMEIGTKGESYLPPGARLEYYYEIRNESGNLLTTELSELEFVDNRFEWQSVRIGPLELNYHDLPASQVADVKQRVTGPLEELNRLLQLDEAEPVQGVIYNHRSEAEDVFPYQSDTISEKGVFQGFAFPSHGVFVGVGLDPDLIVHETAHLRLRQALGPLAPDLPAWLDEGFANYAEQDSQPYGSRGLRERGLPLRAMSKVSGTPSQIGFFYVKSESVVGFMIEHWGTEKFQDFLGQLRLGVEVESALIEVYGVDVDGLEVHWAAEATGPEAPGRVRTSQPSPFLYLDVWVFGGLVLAVFIFLGVRTAYRRLRRQPAGEEQWEGYWVEGLTPLEDKEDRNQG